VKLGRKPGWHVGGGQGGVGDGRVAAQEGGRLGYVVNRGGDQHVPLQLAGAQPLCGVKLLHTLGPVQACMY